MLQNADGEPGHRWPGSQFPKLRFRELSELFQLATSRASAPDPDELPPARPRSPP